MFQLVCALCVPLAKAALSQGLPVRPELKTKETFKNQAG